MLDIINKHNQLIERSIKLLEAARTLIASFGDLNNEKRVNTTVYDIRRIIEYANHYLNNNELYSSDTFRYDSSLIHLVDSIRHNDYGISLSENQTIEKENICIELVEIVNQLILENEKLKQNKT